MKKRLYRSDDNKIIAGVFGGIGEYFDIDPTLLRLAYILVAVITAIFPAVVGYLIAWIIIPKRPTASGETKAEEATATAI